MDSIKNHKSGKIVVDSVGKVIIEDPIMEVSGQVIVRKNMNKCHEQCLCQSSC